MKKIMLTTSLLLIMMLSAFSGKAQVFYVYDGAAFNVMLTCNSKSEVQKISFTDAAKSKWIDFKIDHFKKLNQGFEYFVYDGKKREYSIKYFTNTDKIVVTNNSTGDTWTMKRRKK